MPDPAWTIKLEAFFDAAARYFDISLLAFAWLSGTMLLNAAVGVPATVWHLVFLRQHERIGRRAVTAFLRSHRQTELESTRILRVGAALPS